MIVERVKESVISRQKVWKPAGFRASEAGHLCARYHYHARLDWHKRPAPGEKLAWIFSLGLSVEEHVLRLLEQAGVRVVGAQVAAFERASDIVGHIDGFAVINGEEIPIEIKSVSDWNFQRINSFADMLGSQEPYILRWAAQLPLYCYLHGKQRGLWLLCNKQTGELKELPVEISEAWPLLERVDEILREAREAIARQTPPDPDPDYPVFCAGCWCREVGLCPGVQQDLGDLAAVAMRPDVAEAAAIVRDLREAAKRYEAAQEVLKQAFSEADIPAGEKRELFAGTIPVRITAYETTRYDVPAEVRKQYARRVLQRRIEVL